MATSGLALLVRNLARQKLRMVLEDDNGLSKEDSNRVIGAMDEFAKVLASVDISKEDTQNMMLCVLGETYIRKEMPEIPKDSEATEDVGESSDSDEYTIIG